MPEGDMVWKTARTLDRALAGHALTRTDFRVPRFATVDLSGEIVTGTTTYGKNLLTHIGDDWTLHTHLKMDGVWRAIPVGQRWPSPAHTVRVVLETAATQALGILLGVVELLPRAQEPSVYRDLGPDLLSPEWTADNEAEAVRRLRLLDDMAIFDALRDQRAVAGLGTIWAAETLYAMGVHPQTTVRAVDERLPRMMQIGRLKLKESIRTRRPPENAVYGRDRRPCHRCGTMVVRISMGEPEGRPRPAYFCPHCQPDPAQR
ncbi:DNA-formamidopyrimidine glycosylase family protein [Nocardioides sp. Kera G14]|uniref:DNA-formamidopyrimidine glycosylase family protein n=1 Tax=Nocardioides sp. Kera G14 TaxID=2884264 RepID=UPI001D113622|nr:DNA-formamidopyrimidine glycosylase family protein [Nocardioides sp. Kera G14]UDY24965.1 Fpg/Nei family DNA glycosylase [Nocardioides sp. Kera G14]